MTPYMRLVGMPVRSLTCIQHLGGQVPVLVLDLLEEREQVIGPDGLESLEDPVYGLTSLEAGVGESTVHTGPHAARRAPAAHRGVP